MTLKPIADARCSRGGDIVHITGACTLFYPLTRELTPLTADPLPRQRLRETIFPDRNQSPTLRRQMAPIPIPLDISQKIRGRHFRGLLQVSPLPSH
jgi:hypothetical protein